MGEGIVLGAAGDIVLWGSIARQMLAHPPGWLMEKMLPELSRSDVLFGNLECAIVPADYPDDQIDSRGMAGKFDGSIALKEAGFDFICLANNHILDGGMIGLLHTRKVVEAQGIVTGGVGETPQDARSLRVVTARGMRIGFLCYAEDSNYTVGQKGLGIAYYSPQAVLEDIGRHRASVDALVISIHADLEFMDTPSPARRQAWRDFARAGATVILGHHPHVPQGAEMIGKSLIVYSLGNFCFQSFSSAYMRAGGPNTARSFLLEAEISRNGVESYRRVPVHIESPDSERPVPLAGQAEKEMLAHLAQLDRMVQSDSVVLENWRKMALKQLRLTLLDGVSMNGEAALLHWLGSLLEVAENRAWVDEIRQAVAENWARPRQEDPYHKPSYQFRELTSQAPQSFLRRLGGKAVREIKRRIR